MCNWFVIHGIKRKPHLSVVWNWYHFVAITILHQPRLTDSADINTRLSDTSSIPQMHGGFLLVSQEKWTWLMLFYIYILWFDMVDFAHIHQGCLTGTGAIIWLSQCQWNTVYPKKYAHGFCFAVLCCGYTLTDFPISIRLTSLALWQSNDCPSASKATLMNMDKYFMWIHYERLHNNNKAKHNKTMCIFLGIYCNPEGYEHIQHMNLK